MKIHEKIEQTMLQQKVSVMDLSKRSLKCFKTPIPYTTIASIVSGQVKVPQYKTLDKLAVLLGFRGIYELVKDTDLEELIFNQDNIIPNSYTYPGGIQVDFLNSVKSPFAQAYITLKPKEQIKEFSPTNKDSSYYRNIIVIKGRLKVIINNEEKNLSVKQFYAFAFDKEHILSNPYTRPCEFIMTTTPKYP